MKTLLFLILSQFALLVPARAVPNVIIIFVDDLGWPDAGPGWSSSLASLDPTIPQTTDLLTPTLDTLAGNGARFTSGYVSCPVCSPSRAGLMTGRHPQRFGYEINPGDSLERNPIFGLPLTESTLGDRMKALGYATAWIGKSHLGAVDSYHPVKRGFDQFYGFLEGHHAYFNATFLPGNEPAWATDPIQRATAGPFTPTNPLRVSDGTYLTDAFGREIEAYIEAHHSESFFIYAPFNAVHEPTQVSDNYLADTSALFPGDPITMAGNPSLRHKLAAMMLAVDKAVEKIVLKLSAHGLLNDTLIIISSDNGAPPADREDKNGSTSLPLRGNKSEVYEGGIRVPFIVHWPAQFGSRTLHAPVSTMDILPTCVAAAGGTVPATWQLDGVNLLPYIRGETAQEPHAQLFWRVESGTTGDGRGPRAIRKGNWKLTKRDWSANWELYDLSTSNGLRETENVADSHPEKVQELIPIYSAWEATLPRPRWDYNTPDYVTPTFVLEDLRVGATGASYLAPEFLAGSNRFAWQDDAGTLWQSTLDLSTGLPAGTPAQVDVNLAAPSANNEGPQWGVSSGGASLFYAKPGAASHLQIWRSGTQLTTNATLDSTGPRVSQIAASPVTGMIFNRGTNVLAAADSAPATVATLPNAMTTERNGRWIPDTGEIVFVNTLNQLVRFNPQTNTSVTLTDDLNIKTDAWAFIAPELHNELCYACVVDRTGIAIYRDLHRGGGLLDRVATLAVPVTETARFLFQMKPLQGARGFNGVSWFSCAAYQNPDVGNPGASAIWLLGLGPDPLHRLPMPSPAVGQPPNDLCLEWKSLALRLSDPVGVGVASEPETVIGEREVFCFYTRTPAGGPAQLRRARTGLLKPDADASGFTSLAFTQNITIGVNDISGQRIGGTETTALVAHDGKLFAATSSRGDNRILHALEWSGVQFLVKDSAVTPWRLDHSGALTDMFRDHLAADTLVELTFTQNGTVPLGAPVKHLVAGLRDIGETGSHIASARTRIAPGDWAHSQVVETPPTGEAAHTMSFAVHLDRDTDNDGNNDTLPKELIFSGLSNGEIYRGTYDPINPERLVWEATADLAQTPAFKLGPVTGLADANGILYAACGARQDAPTDPVTGGIYKRNDHTDSWTLIYAWPNPLPVGTATERQRIGTSLTAVPDPRGCAHDVLLIARSWPGTVELIDPERDHAVTVELDVRDFFARVWNADSIRTQDVTVGYTAFTPATDPITGQRVHLLGVWIQHPSLPAGSGAHFLIRHYDGTWELASIPGPALRAPRCFAVSPFAADNGLALYVGGYDAGDGNAHDTAWIQRGEWSEFPSLTIASPAPQFFDLTWPYTTLDWALETSTDLASWLPVTSKPTRSLTGTSLQTTWPDVKRFFRLRRP